MVAGTSNIIKEEEKELRIINGLSKENVYPMEK